MGGNDFIRGGKGDDILCGGASTQDQKVTMFGGSGDDVLVGGAGDDTLYGGGGDDTLIGGGGTNILNVGSGHNTVDATNDGADQIFGHLN
jgi:Ca2+-binding RTX toxin-like protein